MKKLSSTVLSATVNPAQVCVAGAGHWGKNLIRNFHGLGALSGVCESDGSKRAAFESQYPGVALYESFEAALKNPAIRGIVIATPAETHYSLALAALKAGKDVFVEKPICLNVEDAQRLVDTARDLGRMVMVGHLLRFHPAIVKVQELLAAGVLGDIEYIYSNRLSMGKIRQEENALWSFAPHDISVILALMGQLPIQISATGGAYLQPNIADITVSNLLFSNGARAHIFVSWLHPYKEQRLVVIGSKQMIVFEDSSPDRKLMLYDKTMEFSQGKVSHIGGVQGVPVSIDTAEPLRGECLHFIECLEGRQRPCTPGEEGVAVLHVLEACQRSLQMNGEPVQVRAGNRISVL